MPTKLDNEWAPTMEILRNEGFLSLMDDYPRAKQPFLVAEGQEDSVVSEYILRGDDGTEYKPKDYISVFEKFVRKNPDKIDALKILLEKPKEFTTKELSDLRKKLSSRPERFTEENLRKAYHNELADIISIIRHAAKGNPLMAAEQHVDRALTVVTKGKKFSEEQQKWIKLIRDHLIENLVIEKDDFDSIPFSRHGRWKKADSVFEGKLPKLLTEINLAMIECKT